MTHDDRPRDFDHGERERIKAACTELSSAEAVDLSTASRPTLVLYHERLRATVADLLRLLERHV